MSEVNSSPVKNSESPVEPRGNVDAAYEERWKNFRKRSRLSWIIFLTYVPGVTAIGLSLRWLFSSEIPIFVVAGLWMLAAVVSGNYTLAWRCPRCDRRFFCAAWYHNSFARR